MTQTQNSSFEEAIMLLGDKHSPRRRSAAKRLRKLGDIAAGPSLLAALQREVQDPRTWETQYQMIMALGECGYEAAKPYLEELVQRHFEATMVYMALGDAIVRLGRQFPDDPDPVLYLMGMNKNNHMLIQGAFRATAMLRMKPDQEAVNTVIRYVNEHEPDEPPAAVGSLRFWVAAAAAGWDGPEVESFLEASVSSLRSDLRQAAVASRQKKYLKWKVL
jgi:HEAT repeat protein